MTRILQHIRLPTRGNPPKVLYTTEWFDEDREAFLAEARKQLENYYKRHGIELVPIEGKTFSDRANPVAEAVRLLDDSGSEIEGFRYSVSDLQNDLKREAASKRPPSS